MEEKRERAAPQGGGGGGGQRLQAPVTDMKAPPLRFKFSSFQFQTSVRSVEAPVHRNCIKVDRLKSVFEKSGPALSVLTRVIS